MSLETGVLYDIDTNRVLYWHEPQGRSAGYLPDEPALWDAFWAHRHVPGLSFAHTHPGTGFVGPSYTDQTTFDAVERGLGREVHWVIANETDVALFGMNNFCFYCSAGTNHGAIISERILTELRLRSRAEGLRLGADLMRAGLQ